MKSTPVSAIAAHRLQVDAAGGLQRRAPAPPTPCGLPRFTRPRKCLDAHVVEQQEVGAGAERVGDLVEVAALDLDREIGLGPARAVDGLGEAAGQGDVVLLDQDRVVEAHAVVAPAARRDRGLLQLAQPRRRLAGVEDAGAGPGDRLDEARGEGGDAREVAEEVERGPLGGEQRRGGPVARATSAGTSSRHWPSTTSLSTCSTPHWRMSPRRPRGRRRRRAPSGRSGPGRGRPRAPSPPRSRRPSPHILGQRPETDSFQKRSPIGPPCCSNPRHHPR